MVLGVMDNNSFKKKDNIKTKKITKKKKSGKKLNFDNDSAIPEVEEESIDRPIFGELICTDHDDFEENLHHGYNEDDLLTIEDGYYVTPILEKFSLDEILEKREQCKGNHFWTNNEEEVLEYFYDTFNGEFTKLHHYFKWRTQGALHLRYHNYIEKKKQNTHTIFERARSLSISNSVTELSNTLIKQINLYALEDEIVEDLNLTHSEIEEEDLNLTHSEIEEDGRDNIHEEEDSSDFDPLIISENWQEIKDIHEKEKIEQISNQEDHLIKHDNIQTFTVGEDGANISCEVKNKNGINAENIINYIAIFLTIFWLIAILSIYSTQVNIIIHKIYTNLLIIWASLFYSINHCANEVLLE